MIVDFKDYVIAGILLDIAQKEHSGFARVFDVDQFRDEFERIYNADIPSQLLSASVSKLIELGGGRIVRDPFTRDFIYLDKNSCERLFNEAEDNPDTVIGRAYLIGSRYLEEAFLAIAELSEANLLAEFYDMRNPDRFIDIDHANDPRARKIEEGFEELQTQLFQNNEVAIALGEYLEVARNEVLALRARWHQTQIRAAAFVNQAQQTLIWISREASKTFVGQSAKKLFDLIMDYFF